LREGGDHESLAPNTTREFRQTQVRFCDADLSDDPRDSRSGRFYLQSLLGSKTLFQPTSTAVNFGPVNRVWTFAIVSISEYHTVFGDRMVGYNPTRGCVLLCSLGRSRWKVIFRILTAPAVTPRQQNPVPTNIDSRQLWACESWFCDADLSDDPRDSRSGRFYLWRENGNNCKGPDTEICIAEPYLRLSKFTRGVWFARRVLFASRVSLVL
jgi:hypothetical protein